MFLLTLSKQHTSLTKIFKDFTGIDLSKLFFAHIFSGPCSIGISYTNVKHGEKLPFAVTSFPVHNLKVLPEGLSLTFEIALPECRKDLICKFLELIIGHKEVEFEIENIGKEAEFRVDAPVGGKALTIGKVLKIYNVRVGVKFELHGPPSIGLTHAEMDFHYKSTKLHFEGDIGISPLLEVEAEFKMIGIWKKAFFLPFLSFGNVIARARLSVECPECITALEFGAEVWLGFDCKENANQTTCIMGRGYFGLDEENEDKNYFFFSINQFSYRKVLVALGVKDSPWLAIFEPWMMKNVQFSYSVYERDVPHGKTTQTIPAGLLMKGDITFFWFLSVHIFLRIYAIQGIPTGIVANITTNPVKIGSVFELTAYETKKTGPRINVKVGIVPPAFHIEISGRIAVPIFKLEAKVFGLVTLKGITFKFSAKLLLFKVKVLLVAAFKDKKHPKAFSGFRLKGEFDVGGKDSFLGMIKHAVNEMKKKADAALNKALHAVDKASKKLQGIIANKKVAEKVRRTRQAAFDRAKRGVNKAQRAVEHLCSIKKCKKACGLPKPCFKKHCGCLHYPCGWFKFCCKKICVPLPGFCGKMCIPINPLCLAKAAACLPLRAAAFAAKKVAIGVLNAANGALDLAQKAYMAVATAFAKYNPVFLVAKGLLHLAKLAVDGIAAIVNHFPLVIDKIWFDIDLGTAKGYYLEVGMILHLFGKKTTLKLKIDLKNIWKTIWNLVKKFFSKIFGLFSKLKIKI